MKSIYFIIVILNGINFLYGMESVSFIAQKKEHVYDMNPKVRQIRRYTDIPKMPMRDIKCSIAQLEPFQEYMLKRTLESSFTFNIAMLPKDVCLYILAKAYNDHDSNDKKNKKKRESLFCHSIMLVSHLHNFLCKNPIKIDNKTVSLNSYLMISKGKRKQLHSAVNPSWVSRVFEGKSNKVFSQEDYATIIEVLPEGIDQAQLVRLPSCRDRVKMGLCGDYEVSDSGQCAILLSGFTVAQTLLAIGALVRSSGDDTVSSILYSMGVVMDIAIFGAGIFHGMSRCRDYVIEQGRNQIHNNGVV